MINLVDVLLGMESVNEDNQSFYNKKKEVIVNINFEYTRKYENDILDEYLLLCPEWEKDEIREAIYFYEHEDEYISLPSRFDIQEHQIMETYAQSLSNQRVAEESLNKLHSKGAFRKFKDTIRYNNLEEDWYEYRDQCFCNIAKAWCEKHGIAYEEETV
ncbi:hypothetical protein ACWG0P_06000 [Amedibacillus sp. YH-ame6]